LFSTASASTDYTVVPNEAWEQFYVRKAASLPDGLFEHIDSARNHSVMGLLPEINYAWIVLGNILLLWDYTNPRFVGLCLVSRSSAHKQ
jgi:hypothetical protein